MKNPINQLVESARRVHLTKEASERMHDRLIAYMRENPISAKPISSPYQRFLGIFSPFASLLRMPVMAFILVLLIAVGGATTFAAADALPGNPLYPLKVKVIEPVRGLFAVSPEAQAEFQVSLAETRVNEVERLAATEKLTPVQRVKNQERFDDSLDASQTKLEKLSKHDPEMAAKIQESFTESLTRHEDDLNQFAMTASSSNATEAHSFADHIRIKKEEIRSEKDSQGD